MALFDELAEHFGVFVPHPVPRLQIVIGKTNLFDRVGQ